ncbi:MAG: DUF397 domain-containing protein [Streptosporangiaceae bacterium]|nr:DUF397 domain-containing protein [Streptosporangiaceae bacterium]
MAAQRDKYTAVIWRKSSVSADAGQCVEVAQWRSSILIRDSRHRSGAVLEVTREAWRGLLSRVRTSDGSAPDGR